MPRVIKRPLLAFATAVILSAAMGAIGNPVAPVDAVIIYFLSLISMKN